MAAAAVKKQKKSRSSRKSSSTAMVSRARAQLEKEKRGRLAANKKARDVAKKAPMSSAFGAMLLEAPTLIVTSAILGGLPSVGPIPTDLIALLVGGAGVAAGALFGSHHVVNGSKGVLWSGLSSLMIRGGQIVRQRMLEQQAA